MSTYHVKYTITHLIQALVVAKPNLFRTNKESTLMKEPPQRSSLRRTKEFLPRVQLCVAHELAFGASDYQLRLVFRSKVQTTVSTRFLQVTSPA